MVAPSAGSGAVGRRRVEEAGHFFSAHAREVVAVTALGGKVSCTPWYLSEPTTTGVDLGVTGVTDADLAALKDMPGLSSLNLSGTRVTDAGFDRLKVLTSLERLDLAGTGLTDARLVRLRELPNLHRLNVAETQVTDAGLSEFRRSARKIWVSRPPRALRFFPDTSIRPGFSRFLADW